MLMLPTSFKNRSTLALAAAIVALVSMLASCATRPSAETEVDDEPTQSRSGKGGTLGPAVGVSGTAWAEQSAPLIYGTGKPASLDWEIFRVPGKESTQYHYVQHEGREAVLAVADASGSILRHRHRVEPEELGRLNFSWKVPDTASGANTTLATLDDVPVRVVLAFEGDRSKFSFKNTLLNELSRLLTGEEMPYASLVYSWSRANKTGEVIPNDQTDRIRKLVIESGDQGYNQWRSYERDIRADYRQVFGEEPGALLSFAVFTEGERDLGPLQAWYGPLTLQPNRSAQGHASALTACKP